MKKSIDKKLVYTAMVADFLHVGHTNITESRKFGIGKHIIFYYGVL